MTDCTSYDCNCENNSDEICDVRNTVDNIVTDICEITETLFNIQKEFKDDMNKLKNELNDDMNKLKNELNDDINRLENMIKYLPGIGDKYFESKKEFEDLSSNK